MKKAYFIGISGAGMSATAVLMKEQGWQVSGSDEMFYPPASDYLLRYNIPIVVGYKKRNVPTDTDLFVISRSAKLDPETNEEIKKAIKTGKPLKSFSEIISNFSKDTKNIVVIGSYGKSTCAALLSWCLKQGGKDPSFFIGALPIDMDRMAHIGKGDIFIIEGDEYPTSHLDPRPKFSHFRPDDILLTSAEQDHFNVYPTVESYLRPFKQFFSKSSKRGIILAGIDNSYVDKLIAPYEFQVRTYGLSKKAKWSARNIIFGETTKFDLICDGKKITKLATPLLGKHNIENIVGVSALIIEKKLMTLEKLNSAVSSFNGLYRRLNKKNQNSSVPVYEGFGSSYKKARAAIEAIKLHFPDKKLILVFEPHAFSWRNKEAIFWYDNAFKGAGKIFIYEPPTQGVKTHNQLSKKEIINRVKQAGLDVSPINNSQNSLDMIKSSLGKDKIVLLLTSGNLGGMIEKISQMVENNFPLTT